MKIWIYKPHLDKQNTYWLITFSVSFIIPFMKKDYFSTFHTSGKGSTRQGVIKIMIQEIRDNFP